MSSLPRNVAVDYLAIKSDLIGALRARGFGNAALLAAATGFAWQKSYKLLTGQRHIDLFDFVVLCALVDSTVARIEKGEVAAAPPTSPSAAGKGQGRKKA